MSKLADDLCAEVRRQCEQAEHFKGLWMQANNELERHKEEVARLNTCLFQMQEAAKDLAAKLDGQSLAEKDVLAERRRQVEVEGWWKPSTPRRNLVRAAALIIAEIERLDRAEASDKGGAA